jgi:hypothetical protein
MIICALLALGDIERVGNAEGLLDEIPQLDSLKAVGQEASWMVGHKNCLWAATISTQKFLAGTGS